jgi:hypothetical protein
MTFELCDSWEDLGGWYSRGDKVEAPRRCGPIHNALHHAAPNSLSLSITALRTSLRLLAGRGFVASYVPTEVALARSPPLRGVGPFRDIASNKIVGDTSTTLVNCK